MGRLTIRFDNSNNILERIKMGEISLAYIFPQDCMKFALEIDYITDDKRYKYKDYIKNAEIFVYDDITDWANKMDGFIDNDMVNLVGYQITPRWYKKFVFREHEEAEFTLINDPREAPININTLDYLYKYRTVVYYEDYKEP